MLSTPVWFEHTLPKEMPVCFAYTIAGHRVNHSAKVPVVGGKLAYFIILITLGKRGRLRLEAEFPVLSLACGTWRWTWPTGVEDLASASLKGLDSCYVGGWFNAVSASTRCLSYIDLTGRRFISYYNALGSDWESASTRCVQRWSLTT